MIPFARETITLYNRRKTVWTDGKTAEAWVRRVLTGCSWVRTHERVRSDTEVGYTSSVTCRIPASSDYLPPDQWDALINPAGKFTIAAGDVLIHGEATEEVSAQLPISKIVERHKRRGAIVVQSAKDNSRNGVLPHYVARGV